MNIVLVVNEESLVEKTHEEAVAALHNSGDEVTLVLKYYKAATPYLLKSCMFLSFSLPMITCHDWVHRENFLK